MPPPNRPTRPGSGDPFLAMRFEVRIGSSTEPVAGFSEVSGLDFESAIETFREGGVNQYEHQLAGPLKFPARLVLKHGITDNEDLWSWHQDIVQGRIVRKDISIVLRDIDSTRNRKREWKFRAAAPVKWVGPQFRAGGAEVAIETLELIHKGLGQP